MNSQPEPQNSSEQKAEVPTQSHNIAKPHVGSSTISKGAPLPQSIINFLENNGFYKKFEDHNEYYYKETCAFNYWLRLCEREEGFNIELTYHLVGKRNKEDLRPIISGFLIKDEKELDFLLSRIPVYNLTRHHQHVKTLQSS